MTPTDSVKEKYCCICGKNNGYSKVYGSGLIIGLSAFLNDTLTCRVCAETVLVLKDGYNECAEINARNALLGV